MQGTIFFKVFKSKKLKGKNISITENLTGHRMSILNEAREKFGFMNVWTYDGQILYKDNNDGQRVKIYYEYIIYLETLTVTIKMRRKIWLYILCRLNFFFIQFKWVWKHVIILSKFFTFGNAPLMLKFICTTLLILLLFCNLLFLFMQSKLLFSKLLLLKNK